MNKYRARRTRVGNHCFDSAREAQRYNELLILQRAGRIKNLERQPEFVLLDSYENTAGDKIRGIKYRADFRYFDCDTGQIVVEDVKGIETQVFKIKRKLLEARYPIVLKLVK